MSPPMTYHAAEFYAPGTLEIDQWFRVADADYRALLTAKPPRALLPVGIDRIRLLDIGCGTGRFPALLRPYLTRTPVVTYDFVDPSAHCLAVMRDSLAAPYEVGMAWQCGAEGLAQLDPHAYDSIWAIHSLYYVSEADMAEVLRQMRRLLKPDGRGLVYIAARESFYARVHTAYRQTFASRIEPFRLAQDWTPVFQAAGCLWQQQNLHYEHQIPVTDEALLQSYLHKCVLDDSRPLTEWLEQKALRDLLASCRDADLYRFPQTTALFDFGH